MKNIFKIVIFTFIVVIFFACSKKVEKQEEVKIREAVEFNSSLLGCCPEGGGLLPYNINIGNNVNAIKNDPAYNNYRTFTSASEMFKDHSPFVEINKINPKIERLWFTSSREFTDKEVTELPQQLMFVERNLEYSEKGFCPSDGWDLKNIQEFIPQSQRDKKKEDRVFDQLVKGAVAISDNIMVLSADHIENENERRFNAFNDLYILVRGSDGEFDFKDPENMQNNVIDPLCSDSTWESQPTLAPEGNHIFFVSNRGLDPLDKSGDMNIFYSNKNPDNQWSAPIPFPYNTGNNEITPQISPDGRYLYFATDVSGNYDIMVVEFKKDINGNFIIANDFASGPVPAEQVINNDCSTKKIQINDQFNQKYPHIYMNKANKLNGGNAIFWSSDNPAGYGGFDIYGCAMQPPCIWITPVVLDACTGEEIDDPVVKIDGDVIEKQSTNETKVGKKFLVRLDSQYEIYGGSTKFESYQVNGQVFGRWYFPKRIFDENYLIFSESKTKKDIKNVTMDEFNRDWKDKVGTVIKTDKKENEVLIQGLKRKEILEENEFLEKDIQLDQNSFTISMTIITTTERKIYGRVDALTNIMDDCWYKTCDTVQKAVGAVVPSEKTINNLLITPENITENIEIIDTVYVTKCGKKLDCVELSVKVIDMCDRNDGVINPIVEVIDDQNVVIRPSYISKYDNDKAEFVFNLKLNKEYKVLGGSNLRKESGEYYENYWLKGYNDPNKYNCPISPKEPIVVGPKIQSESTRYGTISTKNLTECKKFYDTVFVAKVLVPKVPVSITNLDTLKDSTLAWFQTAFWELNLPNDLKRHLTELEQGFDMTGLASHFQSNTNDPGKTYMSFRTKSDYFDNWFSEPLFGIKSDPTPYNLANARWIELHPNNMYWGFRPTYEYIINKERILKNRPARIDEFRGFATKADQNIKTMIDIITKNFIPNLNCLKEYLPETFGDAKLLIQVDAWSDQRKVKRGWYVGDEDIEYIAHFPEYRYPAERGKVKTKNVHIAKPTVDESRKKVLRKTDLGLNNVVLSDLRAYFGYKEIYKRLAANSSFQSDFISKGKVFTPEVDNKVSMQDAEILLFTKGNGILPGGSIDKYPYYSYLGCGYKGYDNIRHIQIVISIVKYNAEKNRIEEIPFSGKKTISDGCNTYIIESPTPIQKVKKESLEKYLKGNGGGFVPPPPPLTTIIFETNLQQNQVDFITDLKADFPNTTPLGGKVKDEKGIITYQIYISSEFNDKEAQAFLERIGYLIKRYGLNFTKKQVN